MGIGQLQDGDVDLLHGVLEDARHDDPGPAFPWVLFEGLQRLVPCDVGISFEVHDYRLSRSPLVQLIDEGTPLVDSSGPDPDDPFWRLWWSSMCSWPQRSGDLRRVLWSADFFPTDRSRRADPMHAEVHPDITGELLVSLPAPPGEARRFLFMRSSGGPFSERDRQVLELLRPHLYEIWLDAERRRAGVPPLTSREWEVLAMAAGGLSTADIAAALWISVGTVRKHVEHVREKLCVHSIAAAASKAMPHAPGLEGRGLTPAR